VFINPGKNPDPKTPKNQCLAEVAAAKGFHVEIVDYTGIESPEDWVQRLLLSGAFQFEQVVLVGISMGGYVATVAAEKLAPKGLFLLSPVLYLEPYANLDPQPRAEFITVVHGWDDPIVPVANAYRFAEKFRADIHVLSGDHSLASHLSSIAGLFGLFLDRVKKPNKAPEPTTMAVTIRAPSSTARASHGRGSS
jgi:pimeloyl-ACP methyl ester carboxylesterase